MKPYRSGFRSKYYNAMSIMEPKAQANKVKLSKIMRDAQHGRWVIDECIENLGKDDDLQYEIGEVEAGPEMGSRVRLYHLLQMTLPGVPLIGGFDEIITADSEFDPDGLAIFLDYMALIRRTSAALAEGDYYSLSLGHPDVFGFVRQTELQRMVVMGNLSERSVSLSAPPLTGEWLAGTKIVMGSGSRPDHEIELRGYEGRLYESRRVLA